MRETQRESSSVLMVVGTTVVGPISGVLVEMREKEAAADRQESLNFVGLNLFALSGQGD